VVVRQASELVAFKEANEGLKRQRVKSVDLFEGNELYESF